MLRSLGAFLAGALIAACSLTPSSPPTPVSSSPSSDAAELIVTGSGILCVPWWYGCGAFLAVEPPGWTLPTQWVPEAADIGFSVTITKRDRVRVTGVQQAGIDRIDPGDYIFVVILTSRPEGAASPEPTMSASIGCSVEGTIPPGTGVVTVDVDFNQPPCVIKVSMDVPSPGSELLAGLSRLVG